MSERIADVYIKYEPKVIKEFEKFEEAEKKEK
jgi:hypothetical protein